MRNFVTAAVAIAVALSLVAGATAFGVGAETTQTGIDVDPTPSGPNEAESTHAIVMSVGSSAVTGGAWNDVLVDYSVDSPTADVSNVGTDTVVRIGIDRDGTLPGTQVDDTATIDSVSGQKDGAAVQIDLAGELTLREGDEVVVVIRPVQNPQNAGTASVDVVLNTQGSAVTETGSVTYEQHDASVTVEDQTSAGDQVVVDEVSLSEGGFVAIQNESGASPGEIRGVSEYLGPGTHQDVVVELDEPIAGDTTLYAQAYTDSDANRLFDYEATGGDRDGPYRNVDDNLIGSDSATITYDPDATTTTTTTTTTETTTTTTETTTTTATTETTTTETTTTETTTTETTTTTEYTPTTVSATVSPGDDPDGEFVVATEDPVAGNPVELDASPSSDEGEIVRYRWDLDGDGEFERTGETVQYTFATSGVKFVTLRVVDDDGDVDSVERAVGIGSPDAGTPETTVDTTTEPTTETTETTGTTEDATDGTTETTGETAETTDDGTAGTTETTADAGGGGGDDATEGEQPGFGAGVAVLALVLGVVLAIRRRTG